MGHKEAETTMIYTIYTRVMNNSLAEVHSPADALST